MSDERPNVVVILSDDQGCWAMGCAGNSEIRTPTPPRDAQILFEIAALLRMVFPYRGWRSACGNRFPWRAEIGIPE